MSDEEGCMVGFGSQCARGVSRMFWGIAIVVWIDGASYASSAVQDVLACEMRDSITTAPARQTASSSSPGSG